jgi:hypothetical protein
MSSQKESRWIYPILLFVFGFIFTACSSAPGSIELAELDQEPEAEAEPAPELPPTEEIIPLEDLDEWDLLWISDSSGWDVAEVFAAMVAEDTGKTINVQDKWVGGLPAGVIYESLTGQYSGPSMVMDKMPELVAEAEIIVFYGNPSESINESRPGDWECTSGYGSYVVDCDPEIFSVYIEHLEAIYQKMFELRAGQPTIIRTYDAYNPRINIFKEQGVYEDCRQCWGINYNAAIHQAAAAFNIPVAGIAEAWNGPNWDTDPNDLGYTKDGEHPNELGAQVIAQALRDLGYEPVAP